MKAVCVAMLLLPGLVSADAAAAVLQGHVGKASIVMELEETETDGESVYVTYFYTRFKQDIPLCGEFRAGAYRLTSDMGGCQYDAGDGSSERWVLRATASGYAGTFTGANGKSLAVRLDRVPKGSVPDPKPGLDFPQSLSDYAKLRLVGLRFVPGKIEAINGHQRIQWLSEPLSGLAMFHVVGGYPEPVMAAINRIIDRDYYGNLSNYFGCSGEGGSPGFDNIDIFSYFLDQRFVSYALSSSWYCARNAHPDFGERGTTIDARTGRELQLEQLYPAGHGKMPEDHSDAWFEYRSHVFAPAVVSTFQRLYPARMAAVESDDCNYADPEVWDFPAWYLTEKGLYLGAYFARVMRVCDNPEWSVIPYDLLKERNPELFGD